MLAAALLSTVHLLGLALAFTAIHSRSAALRSADYKRAFRADNLWGISALVLLVTGLMRAFGGFEKGTEFYVQNPAFHAKMTFFVLILAMEVYPMVTLFRWRRDESLRSEATARRIAGMGHGQSLLLVLIVLAAAFMARGIGYSG